MSSPYREDRRVDAVKRLSAVTRNETESLGDVNRERSWESKRDAIADARRHSHQPRRSFADLVKKK